MKSKTDKKGHKHSKYCGHKRMRMRSSTHKRKRSSTHKRSSTRKHKRTMRGGFGAGAGPLGYSWVGKDVNTWPGVAGVPGQSNFLPLSKYGVPAGNSQQLPENTSEANIKNIFGQKGGSLTDIIPQDLVDFGRSLTGGVQGAIYGYQGVERPYSTYSSPVVQNAINSQQKYIDNTHLNLKTIHDNAGNTVAKI